MLELAIRVRKHIEMRIREMVTGTLSDLRKLELVHDAKDQRIFLSGKLAAYEEIEKLVNEDKN